MTKEAIEAKVKDSYTKFKNSGILLRLYPELTGIWEEDKDFWYEEYHEQMKLMQNK